MVIKILDEEIYEWANELVVVEIEENRIPIEKKILMITSGLMLEHIAPTYFNKGGIPKNIFELIEKLDLEQEKIEVEKMQKFTKENKNEEVFEQYSIALYGLNNFSFEEIKQEMRDDIEAFLINYN